MKAAVLSLAGRLAPVDLLQQVRFELTLRAKVALRRLGPQGRAVIQRLREAPPGSLRVNLGCGPLPTAGWLNVDGVAEQADLLQVLGEPLALPDGCAAMAFSEHVLEHLDYPGPARTFLSETHRILRPGGHFRVIVPDAGRAMELYASGDVEQLRAMSAVGGLPIEMINRLFREKGFHRWAWDYELLERELRDAGFSSVRRGAFRDSEIPDLNIDLDEEERRRQSLYAEAVK